jgi:NADH-quinone oxidoreductase subunit N
MDWGAYAIDLGRIGPELILTFTCLLVLLVDLWRMGRDSGAVWFLALLSTFGIAAGLLWASRSISVEIGRPVDLRPELVMVVLVYLLMTAADLWFRGRDDWLPGAVVLLGTALALYRLIDQVTALEPVIAGVSQARTAFGAMVRVDMFGGFFKLIALVSLAVVTCFTVYYRQLRWGKSEFLFCLVTAHVGILFLVATTHLLMIYLSLELLSISSYILAGMQKGDRRSAEASLKYIIYGSLASGLMLFGFSLLYGITSDLTLAGIGAALATVEADSPGALLLAFGLLASVGGFAYKVAAVPFHFGAPDVYEGAPTPVTAFLAVASKAGAFAILLRFLHAMSASNPAWPHKLTMLFAISAAVTMTYGNLAALRQSNLKRLLAYSSIAHVGYLFMGIVALYEFTIDPTGAVTAVAHSEVGYRSILFYLVTYLFMNLGAFGVVIYLANATGSEEIDDVRGLGWKAPWVSGALVVFLLSLTGLPPTAGFIGKYYLMLATIDRGFLWLAVVAALNTIVSLFYYFRIAKALFLKTEEEAAFAVRPVAIFGGTILLLAAGTLWLGIAPGSVVELATTSIQSMR